MILSSPLYPKMDTLLLNIIFFFLLLLLPYSSSSLPLCSDSRAPITAKNPLTFCSSYNGSVCCDSSDDSQLEKRFEAMNITDPICGSLLKSILCSACDKFSAELFKVKSRPRSVPALCEFTASTVKLSSRTGREDNNFCSTVWNSCHNISIFNSPFVQNSTFSKLIDFWQSKRDFCNAFGGPSDEESVCFGGKPVQLNENETIIVPKGMCIEKIDDGSFLNMVAHPDGSNRAFFSNQAGKIWLATIPDQDSGKVLELDESSTFLDLTDQVHLDAKFGLFGLAFHPNFTQNGRLFASFICDKETNPGCFGRCGCNSDVDCDPSKLDNPITDRPCQYYTVVAEYTTNGSASNPSMAQNAKPAEVRRIFSMGLPYKSPAGGQILFGPEDGYLYLMVGDGGPKGDPMNFAQNKKSLLGKILRLDVDNIPSREKIADLGLWGNYSIPRDNPFVEDKELVPEIWALGLRNPWRCSFDSQRPSYFFCGDAGQDEYEEVDIITKGGNYGWRVYEGPLPFTPQETPGGNTSAKSINPIFPILGYMHSDVDKKQGSAAISGGYVYRSDTDPCIQGSYLYGDLYGNFIWAGQEKPDESGNFTSASIPFNCAQDSPFNCSYVPNNPLPSLGYIFSFGEDNKKDVLMLTSSGVYRIVRPSRCNYGCSKESVVATPGAPPPYSSSYAHHTTHPYHHLPFIFISSFMFLL